MWNGERKKGTQVRHLRVQDGCGNGQLRLLASTPHHIIHRGMLQAPFEHVSGPPSPSVRLILEDGSPEVDLRISEKNFFKKKKKRCFVTYSGEHGERSGGIKETGFHCRRRCSRCWPALDSCRDVQHEHGTQHGMVFPLV